MANESFKDKELSETMKGDRKNLKNWRPISLLYVDYKIVSKVLSSRLSKVLNTTVDSDQSCSVPGRTISSNLHILRDVLDYIDRTKETGILVSLDQEKAFDCVNRMFLQNLLTKYGFGSDFRQWICTLYKGANMGIIVNGFFNSSGGSTHEGTAEGILVPPVVRPLRKGSSMPN